MRLLCYENEDGRCWHPADLGALPDCGVIVGEEEVDADEWCPDSPSGGTFQ